MNNAEIKETFNQVISSLPNDVRPSTHESNAIIDRFMSDVNEPLQQLISAMVNKAANNDKLSSSDREQFTQKLINLMVPYIESVANDADMN